MKPKKTTMTRGPTKLAEIRKALISKFGNRCAYCGAVFSHLEMAAIDHISPISGAGLDNLLLLCPNCHREYDAFQPREAEFTSYLRDLLKASSEYRNIRVDVRFGNLFLDLTAEVRVVDKWEPFLVECRAARFLRSLEVGRCIEQINQHRVVSKIARAVLAFPGNILPEDSARLQTAGIEVWDREGLELRFREGIDALTESRAKMMFVARPVAPHRVGDLLQQKLVNCRPGKEDWVIYQNLVRDIFELLFTPALDKPRAEFSDATRTNRRDIILPNHATAGYWRHAREAYHADYVVVDAKNYTDPITKGEVLQVANYLKPYGAGLFGIIVSRLGADSGAIVTLRDCWKDHRKLIVVMNDTDVRAMLTTFGANGQPEQIIKDLITEFRLTM